VELAHKAALVSVVTMTNIAKVLKSKFVTLKIATKTIVAICHPITHLKINHPLMNNLPQTNPPAHPRNRMIINRLKRPLMTNLLTFRLINRIIKFLPLLHPLIKSHLKVAMIKVVAVEVVMNTGAIIATGVNGASAHKTAALVPKPTLVQFWDHPMDPIIVPKLRSHSHAILMLAHKRPDKQPLQIYLSLMKS
jgi:hypothetical protein